MFKIQKMTFQIQKWWVPLSLTAQHHDDDDKEQIILLSHFYLGSADIARAEFKKFLSLLL